MRPLKEIYDYKDSQPPTSVCRLNSSSMEEAPFKNHQDHQKVPKKQSVDTHTLITRMKRTLGALEQKYGLNQALLFEPLSWSRMYFSIHGQVKT